MANLTTDRENIVDENLTSCCSVVSCVSTEHISPKFEAHTWNKTTKA